MEQLSHEQQLKLITDLEVEMIADMFNRLSSTCQKKCIPPKYKESELSKGESVCLDRCTAKYLEIHDRIGKKLSAEAMKDQEAAVKLQAGQIPQIPK